MGPVAQQVFKTCAVWQPHARSVRLRRRSVTGVAGIHAGNARPAEHSRATSGPGLVRSSSGLPPAAKRLSRPIRLLALLRGHEREFQGSARVVPPQRIGEIQRVPRPVARCPDCGEALHPQPLGGWVCKHGWTDAPGISSKRRSGKPCPLRCVCAHHRHRTYQPGSGQVRRARTHGSRLLQRMPGVRPNQRNRRRTRTGDRVGRRGVAPRP